MISIDVLEYSFAPSSEPSASPTPGPTSNPTISSQPSGTPIASPTASPTLAPTRKPELYPKLPPPPNAPNSYFNYDRSSTAQYGPGSDKKEWINVNTTHQAYVYENNQWANTKFVGKEDYWHEFAPDGFG
jgi:hypothetical protein